MTDKPKRKNLSPDELLEQAKLLYPENEAFVRGETRKLHHLNEVYGNFYFRRGFGIGANRLKKLPSKQWIDFAVMAGLSVLLIFFSGVLGIGLIQEFTYNFDRSYLCLSPIPISFLIFGIAFIWNAWKIATTNQHLIHNQTMRIAQDGKVILGTIVQYSNRIVQKGYSSSNRYYSFDVTFVSPYTNKQKTFTWWTLNYFSSNNPIILLYLNDDCVIVL